MKYTNEIQINLAIKEVIDLFDNPENLKFWQPGLISFEHLSGTPGQKGARTRLKYKMGKREIEMIETITIRDLPKEFTCTYETKGVFNIVRNYFIQVESEHTLYRVENEFHFSGIYKLYGFLMPGAFRRETRKSLERFRDFAEKAQKH